LPYVISTTIVSFFATLIFDPNIGYLNNFLGSLGMQTGAWFGDSNWAFKLMIMLIFWQGSGSGIMIFYSNFMDISQDVMEACRVDGCTEWQRFLYILLPLSLPSCASIITMSTIWALAIFDFPYILGGINGGVNGCLDFANTVFYRYTFGSGLNGKQDWGFGSAICLVIFLIMMTTTFLQSKILARFEYDT
jgi:ABC-type sugar transport system permease subunit